MVLTEKDLLQVEQIVDNKIKPIDAKLDKVLEILDGIAGNLKSLEEDHEVLGHHVSGQEDRLTALEDLHPSGQHTS